MKSAKTGRAAMVARPAVTEAGDLTVGRARVDLEDFAVMTGARVRARTTAGHVQADRVRTFAALLRGTPRDREISVQPRGVTAVMMDRADRAAMTAAADVRPSVAETGDVAAIVLARRARSFGRRFRWKAGVPASCRTRVPWIPSCARSKLPAGRLPYSMWVACL